MQNLSISKELLFLQSFFQERIDWHGNRDLGGEVGEWLKPTVC